MKKFLKPIGFGAAYLGIYLAINLVVSFAVILVVVLATVVSGVSFQEIDFVQLSVQYATTILILSNFITIPVIGLIYLGRKVKLFSHIRVKKFYIKDALLVSGFALFFNLILVAVVTVVLDLIPPNPLIEQYVQMMEPLLESNSLLLIISVVIAAPVFEEFLCRGVILADFRGVTSFKVANVIQAIVFGIIHMNIVQGLYAFALGLVFGYVVKSYGSIWLAVIMHAVNNGTSLLVDALFPNASLLAMGIIGVIGTVAMVYIMKSQYQADLYIEVEEEAPSEEVVLTEL